MDRPVVTVLWVLKVQLVLKVVAGRMVHRVDRVIRELKDLRVFRDYKEHWVTKDLRVQAVVVHKVFKVSKDLLENLV